MISKFISFFCVLIILISSVSAGISIDQETTGRIQETAPHDADAVIETLNYTLINNDYRETSSGGNQALIFYRMVQGKKEAGGIVKYVDKASKALTTLGILPSEQAARERFAFLLHEVLQETSGINFGVPLTLLLKLPHVGSNTGNLYIASFQEFISPHIPWQGTSEEEINNIPQEEFQKLLFHVILDSTDAHKGNILLAPIQNGKGKTVYTPVLIDLSGIFPTSSTSGALRRLYGWMMYRSAQQPLTDNWKKSLENLDIPFILDTMQLRWQEEVDYFGHAAQLPEEVWDLLTLTLHTVKYGAKYGQTLQTMASIFVPVKTTSQKGEVSFVGGEIELFIKKYFDSKSKRWVRLGEALEELEQILSGATPRRIERKTNFEHIDWCQING